MTAESLASAAVTKIQRVAALALIIGVVGVGLALYALISGKHAQQPQVYQAILAEPHYSAILALGEPELVRYRRLGAQAAALGPSDVAAAAQRYVNAVEQSVTLDVKRRAGAVQGPATADENAANHEWGQARQELLKAFGAAF